MEKRLILAIVLSFLVLMAYQYFFVRPAKMVPVEPSAATAPPPPPGAAAKAQEPPTAAPGPLPAPSAEKVDLTPASASASVDVAIDTSLYTAVWTNRGALLKSWKLKRHRDSRKNELELVPQLAAETGRYPFSVAADEVALAAVVNEALYEAPEGPLVLADGAVGELRFVYSDGRSVRAEKVFRFTGGTYAVETDIRVWKDGRPVPVSVLWGPGIGNPTPEEMKQSFSANRGSAVYTGGKVIRMQERKYKAETSVFNFVDWAAYEENYFVALFVLPPRKGQAAFLKETVDDVPAFFLAATEPRRAFIGPKETAALVGFGHEAKRAVHYGAFGAIAEILLVMVRFLHKLVPNWGVAIILLTIVIKIIFFPLTYSSTKSMAKMADLQPKIKAIRAKYKKARTDIAQRREMNEEMMRLYKEHGVNPAGGCLPLLIQLPVFWGVFRMLVVAVEFRHAPFALWIRDLSVRDPYYVTPILMGITQFISQKMTPTSADPSQARMMLIMPFLMTVLFMNFQSGLILYWLTTNVLQIGQQALMNKMMRRSKRETDGKRRQDR